MATVIECSSDNDYMGAIANAGEKLVLVEFYARWTAPSVAISQEVSSLGEEFPEIQIVRCNFDKCPVIES
mgnify:CR=1 FL=1